MLSGWLDLEPFEIIAIKYAHLGNRHPGENFILADPHEFASDLDYFVWVLRRSDCSYLIDTGSPRKRRHAGGAICCAIQLTLCS